MLCMRKSVQSASAARMHGVYIAYTTTVRSCVRLCFIAHAAIKKMADRNVVT